MWRDAVAYEAVRLADALISKLEQRGRLLPTDDDNRVFLLNEDDIIQPGDFARPLDLLYIGQSDYLHTENTYSGKPLNHTRWVTVERLGWGSHIVGRMTVAEYNEVCDSWEKPHQASTRYEFCRGSLPAYKQLALAATEGQP